MGIVELKSKSVVKDKSINYTLHLKNDSQKFLVSQEPYLLDKSEFLTISKFKNSPAYWAYGFFMCAMGLLINVLGKYFAYLSTKRPHSINAWELYAIGIALVIALFLWVIIPHFPSERRRVMKDIDTHFKSAKKYASILKRNE